MFLMANDEKMDDSSLGRARSMTKTLQKKGKAAIVPTTSINTEFAQVVNRFKSLQEEWTKRRITRKVPIITLKYTDPNDYTNSDACNEIDGLKNEKKQLTVTVSSLFKEMQHLKQQNQNMAQRIESLRKVLHESKSYTISLKQRNDNLASDMDFQSDLHEKQRRVWKTKIRESISQEPPHSIHNNKKRKNTLSDDLRNLDNILAEYESTIDRQREQIKHKSQQLEQQKAVFEYEKNQQYAELTKEINQLKNQRQQEIEELKLKIEQNNTEIGRSKQENHRLRKTLEVTNNELNANRKLIEASRPLNATQTEQQLFQLEQDYLNLSEILVACQHRVTKADNSLSEKQHELEDANRLIDEQNKTMEEYKKSMQLLQAHLMESKSDQSDLINALQQEWEQCKEEVMRYKQRCRQLTHDKDQLLVLQNVARNGLQSLTLQTAQPLVNKQLNGNGSANAEMVVQLHDLQRKLQQKEDEVANHEMLMKQLMEQQKAFLKRNKTLVERLKAIKKYSQSGIGHSGNWNFEGDFNHTPPENVSVELKSIYDHYVRSPIIQTRDIIHRIKIKSSQLINKENEHENDYIVSDKLRINTASTILYVFEDILIARQNAMNVLAKNEDKILRIKEENEREKEKSEIERRKLNEATRKLKQQIVKYESEIQEIYDNINMETDLTDLEKLKKENERIAQEFLQGANVWNAEKAIMSAERAQIENDINYIAHNLEQLILERQQFEQEADQFQILYVNLIAHLREKGMKIEIEYVIVDHMKPSQYARIAIKDDNFLSQRRKRNTMRLKLYQATTQPAVLKEEEEELHQKQSTTNVNINVKIKNAHNHNHNHGHSHNNSNIGLKSYGKRNDAENNNNTDKKPNLWRLVSNKQNKNKKSVPIMGNDDLSAAPTSPRTPRSPRLPRLSSSHTDSNSNKQEQNNNVQSADIMNVNLIDDEADAYIPFDEPDAFNLLDFEYRKLAMKFVSENDNFMSQSMDVDAISGDLDLNLMAQEVLSQELQRKQEKLPKLQGWIEKKSPTWSRGWQKRWVIVREYNIFYGKTKTDIKDTKNESERNKFLNAIPLLVVQYIVGTDHSRSGRKFEIVARDPRTGDRRHYQWKATTREECDKWVNGLNEHKKLLAARLQFLANTGENN